MFCQVIHFYLYIACKLLSKKALIDSFITSNNLADVGRPLSAAYFRQMAGSVGMGHYTVADAMQNVSINAIVGLWGMLIALGYGSSYDSVYYEDSSTVSRCDSYGMQLPTKEILISKFNTAAMAYPYADAAKIVSVIPGGTWPHIAGSEKFRIVCTYAMSNALNAGGLVHFDIPRNHFITVSSSDSDNMDAIDTLASCLFSSEYWVKITGNETSTIISSFYDNSSLMTDNYLRLHAIPAAHVNVPAPGTGIAQCLLTAAPETVSVYNLTYPEITLASVYQPLTWGLLTADFYLEVDYSIFARITQGLASYSVYYPTTGWAEWSYSSSTRVEGGNDTVSQVVDTVHQSEMTYYWDYNAAPIKSYPSNFTNFSGSSEAAVYVSNGYGWRGYYMRNWSDDALTTAGDTPNIESAYTVITNGRWTEYQSNYESRVDVTFATGGKHLEHRSSFVLMSDKYEYVLSTRPASTGEYTVVTCQMTPATGSDAYSWYVGGDKQSTRCILYEAVDTIVSWAVGEINIRSIYTYYDHSTVIRTYKTDQIASTKYTITDRPYTNDRYYLDSVSNDFFSTTRQFTTRTAWCTRPTWMDSAEEIDASIFSYLSCYEHIPENISSKKEAASASLAGQQLRLEEAYTRVSSKVDDFNSALAAMTAIDTRASLVKAAPTATISSAKVDSEHLPGSSHTRNTFVLGRSFDVYATVGTMLADSKTVI